MAKDPRDWKFNHPSVPKVINELFADERTVEMKSILVFFSNQLNLNSKVSERAGFESKIDSVIAKLGITSKCPVICLFATARDEFRKPCTGMWRILQSEFLDKAKITIDMKQSFFVGDAAGRFESWKPGRSADWSSVDHKFALNINLKFYTPEEFFLKESPVSCYDLGRNPKSLPASLGYNEPFDFEHHFPHGTVLMIIAVGSPASGKSTFYQRFLKHRNYVHVNRDTLKTMPKCLAAVKTAFSNNQSVYIDNTNPSIESREAFINIAKTLDISVKCLHFTADEWLCKHLDVFRSIKSKTDPLPTVAFNTFRSRYQPPSEIEGFQTIVQVPFVAQFASEEDLNTFQSYLF